LSLTQPTTDAYPSDNQTPLVEYGQAAEQQIAIDAALGSARFSGSAQDQVSGDWLVWADGAIVGWCKTQDEAERWATAYHAARLSGARTLVLGGSRDELPCSIEFQRAKDGTPYWCLKGYYAPGDEDAAMARLRALDAQLTRDYRPELLPAS
jgi:hypothetical protein